MERPSSMLFPSPNTTTANTRHPARTSNTCTTCRARKVRCDGRRTICNNCQRLGYSCSYDDSPVVGREAVRHGGISPGSLPRRRVRQACLNCHARKARCSGTVPKCDRCNSQGIECVYRPGRRLRISLGSKEAMTADGPSPRGDHLSDYSHSFSSDHAEPAAAASPSVFGHETACLDDGLEPVAMRTFDQFFRHIHHVPMFSFLHRASVMQRYHAGLVDRPLLLALVGITALLTDLGPGMKEYGVKCISEAESLVLRELDKPSTLRLQSLVLVIKHRILSRKFSSAFMLYSIASRFAAALRLNYENPRLCFLAQESRRRLMWSLYLIDTSIAGGSSDFSLWAYNVDAIHIQLPCNERNFEYDLPEVTEPLQPLPGPDGTLPPLPDDIGFLALHIRIHLIRSRIQLFTKGLMRQATSTDIDALPSRCAEILTELDSFASRMPASFRWSEGNIRLRTYSPRLCVFLMTHLWWEQCHCDLYRLALSGLREALPRAVVQELEMQHPTFVAHCQRQVFAHARAMADMFSLVLTLDNGIPIMDLDFPVCVYQCARILSYALRIGPDNFGVSPESVTELMGVCSKILAQSISTPASLSICADLEKLVAHGLSAASTPNRAASPDPSNMQIEEAPISSRHSLTNEVVMTADEDTPAIPQTPADVTGSGRPHLVNLDTPCSAISVGTCIQELPQDPMTSQQGTINKSGIISNGTSVSHTSNAFEGALDGLDFDLEPFGMDTLSWFSSDWLNEGIPQVDMTRNIGNEAR